MKRRLFVISFGVVCALLAAGLVLFATSRAEPALADSLSGQVDSASQQNTTIIARRLISVPFGIQSSLEILNEKQVLVTGHGSCATNGVMYKLRTTITQGNVKGNGYTQDLCQGSESFMWSTIASANPAKTFKPGLAEACGMAIIYSPNEGAIVKKWCKQVTLTPASP